METYGGWNPAGEKLIRFIARSMSWRNGIPFGKPVVHLFQRMSIALLRGNANAILKRLEDLGRPLIETNIDLGSDPAPRYEGVVDGVVECQEDLSNDDCKPLDGIYGPGTDPNEKSSAQSSDKEFVGHADVILTTNQGEILTQDLVEGVWQICSMELKQLK